MSNLLYRLGRFAARRRWRVLGAWLVRRFVSMPLLLSEPADLARFMLMVTPLACLTSASVAVPVARLARASSTPGTAASARSMRPTQAAQVMPPILSRRVTMRGA